MSDTYEQLVAALRAVVAQTGDPMPVVAFALQAIEQENLARRRRMQEVPGPYAPNPMSIYAERLP
ncbi:hypothetical protein [Methylobacterium dankookense]|uniref:Uncharacterized protein n=1 Tax=Methylobacterium dankookense TaxID=560405 RepID=A0A564FWC4_9HYPH|nr:hypothetical protein [Methylobacterium dankookense]GJD58453.1 hypothetical protein IFDJLNFL_4374 [Methylobacterium dankookense]VUF12302.1 hypothetical protein MTDSW087_01991 [Methylobacterium dankookense]